MTDIPTDLSGRSGPQDPGPAKPPKPLPGGPASLIAGGTEPAKPPTPAPAPGPVVGTYPTQQQDDADHAIAAAVIRHKQEDAQSTAEALAAIMKAEPQQPDGSQVAAALGEYDSRAGATRDNYSTHIDRAMERARNSDTYETRLMWEHYAERLNGEKIAEVAAIMAARGRAQQQIQDNFHAMWAQWAEDKSRMEAQATQIERDIELGILNYWRDIADVEFDAVQSRVDANAQFWNDRPAVQHLTNLYSTSHAGMVLLQAAEGEFGAWEADDQPPLPAIMKQALTNAGHTLHSSLAAALNGNPAALIRFTETLTNPALTAAEKWAEFGGIDNVDMQDLIGDINLSSSALTQLAQELTDTIVAAQTYQTTYSDSYVNAAVEDFNNEIVTDAGRVAAFQEEGVPDIRQMAYDILNPPPPPGPAGGIAQGGFLPPGYITSGGV